MFPCIHWSSDRISCDRCGEKLFFDDEIEVIDYSSQLIGGVTINPEIEPKINIYGTELSKNEIDMLLEVFRMRSNNYKPHRKYH